MAMLQSGTTARAHGTHAHASHQPHGSGVRGLTLEHIDHFERLARQNSPEFEGRFRRMFNLPAADPDDASLDRLAAAMKGDSEVSDEPDTEESDIPAAYTYLGQFIDHDLTFDPSTLDQQRSDPAALVDFRTPRFDLDNLYGRGPADQPYFYDICVVPPSTSARNDFLLGDKLLVVKRNPNARDLPRAAANAAGTRRAIIGDARNDENVIVSQFHGMVLRFHNAVARSLNGVVDVAFETVQNTVRWHYQWMVVHDFLPRVVKRSVLDEVSPGIADPSQSLTPEDLERRLRFYKFHQGVMPVEFSAAAYRFGHSMVRPGYRVNEFTTPLRIFDHENPTNGLNAFGEFPRSWAIDWQRFVDLGLPADPALPFDRVQLAYKIDTSLVEPLANLPDSVAGPDGPFSLAFRNLLRGKRLGLPSGQDIAIAMGVDPLDDSQILIGATDDDARDETTASNGKPVPTIVDVDASFKGRSPLWTYVLAEARHNFFTGDHLAQLGAVGGRIVAETFLGLLLRDERSFLHQPNWTPRFGSRGTFTLADMLRTALEA